MPRRREYIAYRITCLVNGRIYIGITSYPLSDRWRSHLYSARVGRRGPRSVAPLALAIREFGVDSFHIEHIASAYSWADLLALEQRLIQQWGSMCPVGYNASAGGMGTPGRKQGDEERAMRSLAAHEKMKDPKIRAKYVEHIVRLNKRPKPRKGICVHGHSLADAYKNGRGLRCRVCTDENHRSSRRAARAAGLRSGKTDAVQVVYNGVVYPSVNAVARAFGKGSSWARRRFKNGDIRRQQIQPGA